MKQILEELKEIKRDIKEIKLSLGEYEVGLTAEERKLLEQSIKHEKQGKLISAKDLRLKLGI